VNDVAAVNEVAAAPVRRWPWYAGVGVLTAGGLGLRIATVYGRPNRAPGGDAYTYHYSANLLASGHGFINPWLFYGAHHSLPSAAFPPLFILLLSMTSVVGLKTFFVHRIWSCIIGAAAIPICAYTGKEIGGRRVGLLAAFLVTVYPNIWMNDELAMSEALTPVVIALVLLAAYRFWHRPRALTAAALGVSLALSALARDETALLAVLVVPLALLARRVRLQWRVALIGIAAAGFVGLVGPWVGFNLARFDKPTFISNGLGVTLASANCPATYNGVNAGYWSYNCALATPGLKPIQDQSVADSIARTHALKFVRAHLGELPRVELDREGRAFGFFRPLQQIQLDSLIETRPLHWAQVGLGMYYFLVLASIPGIVSLRRRRVPIYPLLAIGLDVVISVAVTFGQTRYRIAFEVVLVLMAAVGLDASVRALTSRLRPGPERDAQLPPPDAEPEPDPEPEPERGLAAPALP
jgi:4-amino-4-deoxy-L-arabinose transferase-like glycosyltransferase